jgi:heme-degrading monooxygenase HmoA
MDGSISAATVSPDARYYAVIFSSHRNESDAAGYAFMAEKMLDLASGQPGFLGVDSARGEDGFGITVSYWESREAIAAWRAHAEHRIAQELGRSRWYRDFRLRICQVESEYAFPSPSTPRDAANRTDSL